MELVMSVGPADLMHPYDLEVQWTVNLGAQGTPALRVLMDVLEEVHGVEYVVMGRYSARLQMAPHVAVARVGVALELDRALEDRLTVLRAYLGSDLTVRIEVPSASN